MSEGSEREPLESALAGLKPAPVTLDRDRLMFAAGQAAARPRRWLWPASSAALFCLSLSLGAALVMRPAPVETVRIVYLPPEAKERDRGLVGITTPSQIVHFPPEVKDVKQPLPDVTPAPAPGSDPDGMVADTTPTLSGDYLRLRRQVLRFGVESLPEAPPLTSPGKALSIDSLIEEPKKRS